MHATFDIEFELGFHVLLPSLLYMFMVYYDLSETVIVALRVGQVHGQIWRKV